MDSPEMINDCVEPSKGAKSFDGSVDTASSRCSGEGGEADYYIENGLLVFTASYHIRRGYCCKSGCRHCPFGFRKKP